MDGQDGPPDAVGRRVRRRDTHGWRSVRVSRGPRSRRLFPERRFRVATRMQRPRAGEDQPDRQIKWVQTK